MIDFGKRIQDLKTAKYIFDALNDLNFFFIEEPLKINFNKYIKLKKKYPLFNIPLFFNLNLLAGSNVTLRMASSHVINDNSRTYLLKYRVNVP